MRVKVLLLVVLSYSVYLQATVDDIPNTYISAFQQSAYPFEDPRFYDSRPDYYWDGQGWVFDDGYEVHTGRCGIVKMIIHAMEEKNIVIKGVI